MDNISIKIYDVRNSLELNYSFKKKMRTTNCETPPPHYCLLKEKWCHIKEEIK